MKSILGAFVLVACLGTAAMAQSNVCNNHQLLGNYGFTISGFRIVNGSLLPMEGTALTTFDGNGGLTQVDNVNTALGPLPADRPATGTYQVNPDCSGTMTITADNAPPLHLRIVVVAAGAEVRTGVVTPGVIVTSNGRRTN